MTPDPASQAAEEPLRHPRFSWPVLLGGPVIFMLHFGAVYLLAEWVCGLELRFRLWGASGVTVVTLALTAVAAVAVLPVVRRGWTELRWGDDGESHGIRRFVGVVGLLGALVFGLGILFVGLPALWLTPC